MNNFAVKCFCQVVGATSFSGMLMYYLLRLFSWGDNMKQKSALETHTLFYLRVTSPNRPVWCRRALHLQRFISIR